MTGMQKLEHSLSLSLSFRIFFLLSRRLKMLMLIIMFGPNVNKSFPCRIIRMLLKRIMFRRVRSSSFRFIIGDLIGSQTHVGYS